VLDFVKGSFDDVIVYAGNYPPQVSPIAEISGSNQAPVLIWTEIGRIVSSPFEDTRPNQTNKPETRYYRMCYLKKQVAKGLVSDIITVTANVGSDLATKVK
jgi:hypothetical protein